MDDDELAKDVLMFFAEKDIQPIVAVTTMASCIVSIINAMSHNRKDALISTQAIARDMIEIMEKRANAS